MFRAHCARDGHPVLEFTDPAACEQHMVAVHHAAIPPHPLSRFRTYRRDPEYPLKPWKRPPRRAYAPKPLDPGQPITYIEATGGWNDGQWIDQAEITRTGAIWSGGPATVPRSLWVVPDDHPASVVLVRWDEHWQHGGRYALAEADDLWRDTVRRKGVYVVSEGMPDAHSSIYGSGRRRTETCSVHTDPDCPEARGKPRITKVKTTSPKINTMVEALLEQKANASQNNWCMRCVWLRADIDVAA